MKRPVIAIIGRPNVGKSTLFNRLIGRRQAIVEDQPGITRDRHYTEGSHGRHSFTLVDTGGLDPTAGPEEEILSQIRDQTRHAIGEADILIAVFDGRSGLTALDDEIVKMLRPLKKRVYYAVNKIDTPKQDALASEFFKIGAETIYPVSAEKGTGLGELLDAALKDFPKDRPKGPFKEDKDKGDKKGDEIPKIAVVGRPNVGKSTLINTLLGEDRLLTSNVPGTTRDAIDTLVTHNREKMLFIDTAGIRRRGKIERGVERFSLTRSQAAIKRCDLAVVLLDASEGLVEQDTKIIGTVLQAKKACLILVNKWDLHKNGGPETDRITSELERRLAFIPFATVLFISALKKTGLNPIFREIGPILAGFSSRIPTGALNRAFEKTVASHPPPQAGSRKPVKLNYITQTGTKPPTFVIFSNRPEAVKQPYIRYLENEFRTLFDFPGSPLIFHLRKKTGEPPKRTGGRKKGDKKETKSHGRKKTGESSLRPKGLKNGDKSTSKSHNRPKKRTKNRRQPHFIK